MLYSSIESDSVSLCEKHSQLLDKIYYVMKKLSNLVPAAMLTTYILLRVQINNPVGWTLIFSKLEWHREVRRFYDHHHLAYLKNTFFTNCGEAELYALFQKLKDLYSATRKLQCNSTINSNTKTLFNGVTENNPELSSCLTSTSIKGKTFYFKMQLQIFN